MTRTMDNAIATLHPFPGSAVRGDGPKVDARRRRALDVGQRADPQQGALRCLYGSAGSAWVTWLSIATPPLPSLA